MSGVRVLVGTRKGAFILTSDGKREKWDVSGPLFAGWEIYHLKGSPADPNRLYASQSSGWFGQIIQRSDDGGKTWHQPGTPPGEPTTTPDGMPKGESNKFVYDTSPETGKPLTTHQWYDGTQHPWEFKRVWHLEPSLNDPDTVYAGVEDAALFRSTDGGTDVAGASRSARPRYRGLSGRRVPAACVCTPSFSIRAIPNRIYIAISSAGAFRTDDARQDLAADQSWTPFAIHPRPECRGRPLRSPHRDASVASGRAVHAKTLGRHAQRQRRRIVAGDQRQPADRLRLCDRRSCPRTGDHLRRADQERLGAFSARRKATRVSQPHGRQRVGTADQRLAAKRLLRQRIARRDGRRFAR